MLPVAEAFAKEAEAKNISKDESLLAARVGLFANLGDMKAAEECFQEIKSNNLPILRNAFTYLIVGYNKQNKPDKVEEWTTEMKKIFKPPGLVFIINRKLEQQEAQPSSTSEK